LVNFSSAEFFGFYPDHNRAQHDVRWQTGTEVRDVALESDNELYSWNHPLAFDFHAGPKMDRLAVLTDESSYANNREVRILGSKQYVLERPEHFMYVFEGTLSRVRHIWSAFWKRYEVEYFTSLYRLSVLKLTGFPSFVTHEPNFGGMLGLIEWSNMWSSYFKLHSLAIKEPQEFFLRTAKSGYKTYQGWWFFGRKDLWNRQYVRRRLGDFDIFTQMRDDHYRRIIRLQRSAYIAETSTVLFQTVLFFIIFSAMSYMDFLVGSTIQFKSFDKQQKKPEGRVRTEEAFEDVFVDADDVILIEGIKDELGLWFAQKRVQWNTFNDVYLSKVQVRKFSKAYQTRHEALEHRIVNDRPRMGSSVDVYYMHNIYDFKKQKMDTVNFLSYDIFMQNPSKYSVGEFNFIEILADRYIFAKGIMNKSELVVFSDYFLFYFYQVFDYV